VNIYLGDAVASKLVIEFVSSTHETPFQYKADPVAAPFASEPEIVTHFVDVPVVDKYCPVVPVAPDTSRKAKFTYASPFNIIAPLTVVVASVDVPSTANVVATFALFILVVASVVVPVDAKNPVVVAFEVVLFSTFNDSTFITEAQRFDNIFRKPTLEDAAVVVAKDDVPDTPKVLDILTLSIVVVARVVVAAERFCRFVVPVAVMLFATKLPVVVALVPVALPKIRFVNMPVTAFRSVAKKFVEVA
jgi:hypothetical protein